MYNHVEVANRTVQYFDLLHSYLDRRRWRQPLSTTEYAIWCHRAGEKHVVMNLEVLFNNTVAMVDATTKHFIRNESNVSSPSPNDMPDTLVPTPDYCSMCILPVDKTHGH